MEIDDLNLRNPVQVGYYDPFNVYPLIKDELQSKLPLTNLHWKYNISKPLKSIPLLPVTFVEEVPKHTLVKENDKMYSRIMFIKYENLDTYRAQVRPLIKEWLKQLVSDSEVEWAIILLMGSSLKDKLSTIIKTSIFDKLKIDFGIDGKELQTLPVDSGVKERCFKLREVYEDDMTKLESYNELINHMKDFLVSSFNNKYVSFNQMIYNHQATDFKAFILKLKLADLLNDMRLLNDSLSIYNELSNDLNKLYYANPSKFETEITHIPSDLNGYQFEQSFSSISIKNSLNKEKINLFELKSLIFVNQSSLLQLLANYANSISLSSISISSIYQKLLYFLNDLSNIFGDKLNEWIFVVIDNYLKLPICNKIMNDNMKSSDGEQYYQLSEILEFKGELKLSQRSKLAKVANSHGYAINGINEILEEISLNDDTSSKNTSELSYKPLLEILLNENTYYKHFEKLTELIIHDFVNSGRTKTIDILSIDLALLNYQIGNYQESLNILQDSYEFFINNSWNFMGGILLEIYLNCTEKLDQSDYSLISLTCLRLFSNLVNPKNGKYGINNYKLIKPKVKIARLFEKIEEYSGKLNELIEFPLEKIFKVDIKPFIQSDESTYADKYFIQINLTNYYGIEFSFKEIKLMLENSEGVTSFNIENVMISNNVDNTLKLYSNNFKFGSFNPSNITVKINNNLCFTKRYSSENGTENDDTVIQYNNETILKDSFLNDSESRDIVVAHNKWTSDMFFYQSLSKFSCEFCTPIDIDLESTEIILRIKNGHNNVEDVNIDIISNTNGLKINKELLKDRLKIMTLSSKESIDIKIPYSYYSDNKIISLKANISYSSNGENFSHFIIDQVDTTLTISVSVQDIFKSQYIFSKFQVGTSNPKLPIRILSNDLTTKNENYSIISPKHSPRPITFGDQPASYFYKIIPKSDYSIKSLDSLDLRVEYSDLKNECYDIIQSFLLHRLQDLQLRKYWFLIKSLLFKDISFDLNNYAVNLEVRIINNREIELLIEKALLKHIEETEDKKKLIELFKHVLFDNEFKFEVMPNFENKQLIISVPIPVLNILQIIEFEFERKPQYLVGEPILMNLKIESITKWSNNKVKAGSEDEIEILAESSPSKPEKPSVQKENFQLSIQTDDNWLISGFRKESFQIDYVANENKSNFEVVLIPLTVGRLLLPKINVRTLDNLENDFSMDINFKNGLETLLVVPDVNSITFSF